MRGQETAAPTAVPALTDLHLHVLPGVDDGPATLDEAVAVCRLALADGCETLIVTPHQRHAFWSNREAAMLRSLCEQVQQAVGERPRVLPGAEIAVDSELLAEVDDFAASGLLALADSRYLLLEFPGGPGGPEPRGLVHELVVAGWRPILAHAERIPRWVERPEELAGLVEIGAAIQITAGSVLGSHGRGARTCCSWLLDRGLVHFAGSDAHDTVRRPPGLSAAWRAIRDGWGEEAAQAIFVDHPAAILADRPLAV